MRTEKTGKERFNELRYQMEKNSFVLSVIESRTAAVLHAESMGYDDTSTAMICRINAEYVKLIKAVKDQHPGSIEDVAQELYDRIYMQTGWKRDYSRFQLFDEELIERWFIVKEQERQLRAGNIDLDDLISTAKHAYWSKTGKDVDVIVKEIPQNSEQTQQEVEPETEPDDEDDTKEMIRALNERVAQDEIVCQMYRDGAISEETALKYTGGDLGHESFMKLVKICTDEEKTEVDVDFWCETQKKEHQMEFVANMVASGAIMPEVAFEYMNKDNDFHDYDNFLRILDVWIEKEEKQHDDSDD